MRRFRYCFTLSALILLAGCEDPQTRYFQEIIANGFIPFRQPMSGVGSGMMIRGTPMEMFMLAPPNRCLPYNIDNQPSDLRWTADTAIAEKHYAASLNFNAAINSIVTAGTPSFTFKFNMTKIKTVDFELKDAKIEMVDQLNLEEYFQFKMSDACRGHMTTFPFVLNGLMATEMSFVFRDYFGGKIELSVDNLEEIVDIEAGVEWKIENNYKLVFTTPKFIGYHLAKLRPEDNGFVRLVATETAEDAYVWKEIENPINALNYLNVLNRLMKVR